MSRAFRVILACFALAALGCPSAGPAAEATGPDDPSKGEGADREPDEDAGPVGEVVPGDCDDRICAYHPGSGSYHACYHAAAGACVRYGRACEPADRCMFDADTGAYRRCERAASGRCQEFGTPCAPKDACMYDPAGELHHRCEKVAEGRCERFGPPCEPAQHAR